MTWWRGEWSTSCGPFCRCKNIILLYAIRRFVTVMPFATTFHFNAPYLTDFQQTECVFPCAKIFLHPNSNFQSTATLKLLEIKSMALRCIAHTQTSPRTAKITKLHWPVSLFATPIRVMRECYVYMSGKSGNLQSFAFIKFDRKVRYDVSHKNIEYFCWHTGICVFFSPLLPTVSNTNKPGKHLTTAPICIDSKFCCCNFPKNKIEPEMHCIDWMHFTSFYCLCWCRCCCCCRKHANRIIRFCHSSFRSSRIAYMLSSNACLSCPCTNSTQQTVHIHSLSKLVHQQMQWRAIWQLLCQLLHSLDDDDDAPGADIQLYIIIYNWVVFASSTSSCSSSSLLCCCFHCHCITNIVA